MASLLSIEDLSICTGTQALVSGLSLAIGRGARHGVIGESGSGKSLTALAVTGLLPKDLAASGSIVLGGQEVVDAPIKRMDALRGDTVAVIFQEPLTALDPLMKMGRQVALPVRRQHHRTGRATDRDAIQREVRALLERVALPEPERIANAYPFEVSGGQRQRVAIAMALACKPKLLIADEPTTALDVTTQAEVLDLLARLVEQEGMALMFISHDLPVVAQVVDTVSVLQKGHLVESGPVHRVLTQPQHGYTKTLVDAAAAFDTALGRG